MVWIESDKYTGLMNGLIGIGKENDRLLKENIMLQEYIAKI